MGATVASSVIMSVCEGLHVCLGAGLQSNRDAVYTINKLNWSVLDDDCFYSETVFVSLLH